MDNQLPIDEKGVGYFTTHIPNDMFFDAIKNRLSNIFIDVNIANITFSDMIKNYVFQLGYRGGLLIQDDLDGMYNNIFYQLEDEDNHHSVKGCVALGGATHELLVDLINLNNGTFSEYLLEPIRRVKHNGFDVTDVYYSDQVKRNHHTIQVEYWKPVTKGSS